MKTLAAVGVLGAAGMTCSSGAQNFNIDFGPAGTGPSAGHGAAGLPGQWVSIPAEHGTSTFNLADINGVATAVRLAQIGGTVVLDLEDRGTSGDDDALMDDCLATYSATLESCLFFHDMIPGEYEVIVYAMMPSAPGTRAYVSCDQEAGFPHKVVGGAWPGGQVEDVTYSRHMAIVNETGKLYVHSGVVPGDDPGLGAALNGIQLRRIVPCAADIVPVGGNGVVNIDDLTAVILNWGTAGPNGDVNASGAVDIDDLTAVILAWGICD